MAELPGILFRFELLDALEQLDPADIGTIFLSSMRYGRDGTVPTFQNHVLAVVWPFVKSAVDRDAKSYDNKTAQRRYAVYVREAKRKDENPMSFDEWKTSADIESYRSMSSIDSDNHTQLQSQTQIQSHTQEQEQIHDDGADKPPTLPRRFTPPSVEQVQEYCQERKNTIDAASFVDYYAARGWKLNGGQTMKDWKAAVRTWERRDKSSQPEQPPTVPKMTYHTEIIDGEEVDVPDA